MKATLMNKNTPLMEVELEGKTITSFDRVITPKMMPIQLQCDFDIKKLNDWLTKRLIPERREGLKEARMWFHGFDEEPHMFSLSDQYWFKTNKNDEWSKLNFFTNEYSKDVGDIFFYPWLVRKDHIKDPSPDRTTNGVLRKRWVQDESRVSYLIKAGSVEYHQEPLSEVMASIMLGQMNLLPFVSYELVIEGMRMCSKCRNFVNEYTEFVPASAIYGSEKRTNSETVYAHLLRMCKKFNIPGAKEYIDNMILLDYVMCNGDRHLSNFGFLRSADDGHIIGFAPLFDCGSAYWGTTDAVKIPTSKLFEDVKDNIIMKAASKGLMDNTKAPDSMMALLEAYPDISLEKKEQIAHTMEKIERMIDRELDKYGTKKKTQKPQAKIMDDGMEIIMD